MPFETSPLPLRFWEMESVHTQERETAVFDHRTLDDRIEVLQWDSGGWRTPSSTGLDWNRSSTVFKVNTYWRTDVRHEMMGDFIRSLSGCHVRYWVVGMKANGDIKVHCRINEQQ